MDKTSSLLSRSARDKLNNFNNFNKCTTAASINDNQQFIKTLNKLA